MTSYIHTRDDWPLFRWDLAALAGALAAVRNRQGRLVGRMEALGFPLRQEASLEALTDEVVPDREVLARHGAPGHSGIDRLRNPLTRAGGRSKRGV